MWWLYVILILWVAHILFVLFIIASWIRVQSKRTRIKGDIHITVIVPFRNEEGTILNLLSDLTAQELSMDVFEVLLVDDHSEDEGVARVKEYLSTHPLNARLLQLPSARQGKKDAILLGVEEAIGEIVVTTDADCRVSAQWLSYLTTPFQSPEVDMVLGPVVIHGKGNLFGKLQEAENIAIQMLTMASLSWGLPTMSNGANLAYRRSAFWEVGGFEGNQQRATGDDVFLLHKFHKRPGRRVVSIVAPETIVTTEATEGLSAFSRQRKRWASKWLAYDSSFSKALGVFVFFLNASIMVAFGLALVGGSGLLPILAGFLLLKGLTEYTLLRVGGSKLHTRSGLITVAVLEIVYPFYAIIFAVTSTIGGYVWKGRRHTR